MTGWLSADFWKRIAEATLESVPQGSVRLLTVLVAYWLARHALFRLIDAGLARLHGGRAGATDGHERTARIRTLQSMVKSVAGYVLFFVLALTVLQTFGINITGVLTTAGVAGIAVGFGAQKLVRDVINGFFIVVEDQFGVGDYVTIGQATGTVEELGMRTTQIRDDQGRLWTLANGDIAIILNHSRGPTTGYIEMAVPSATDADLLREIVRQAGDGVQAEHPDLLTGPATVAGITAFDTANLTVRITVPAPPQALPEAQMVVRQAVRALLIARGVIAQPPAVVS